MDLATDLPDLTDLTDAELAARGTSLRVKAKYAGIDHGHGSPRHMEAKRAWEAFAGAATALRRERYRASLEQAS